MNEEREYTAEVTIPTPDDNNSTYGKFTITWEGRNQAYLWRSDTLSIRNGAKDPILEGVRLYFKPT